MLSCCGAGLAGRRGNAGYLVAVERGCCPFERRVRGESVKTDPICQGGAPATPAPVSRPSARVPTRSATVALMARLACSTRASCPSTGTLASGRTNASRIASRSLLSARRDVSTPVLITGGSRPCIAPSTAHVAQRSSGTLQQFRADHEIADQAVLGVCGVGRDRGAACLAMHRWSVRIHDCV